MTLRIDSVGRITIPQAIREKLGLQPGDLVKVDIHEPGDDRGGL